LGLKGALSESRDPETDAGTIMRIDDGSRVPAPPTARISVSFKVESAVAPPPCVADKQTDSA
jgi:hypothetical protein